MINLLFLTLKLMRMVILNSTPLPTGDGVPAGDFLVAFEWREKSGTFKNQFNGSDKLKGRFSKPETSTFKVTITNQPITLEPFELKIK